MRALRHWVLLVLIAIALLANCLAGCGSVSLVTSAPRTAKSEPLGAGIEPWKLAIEPQAGIKPLTRAINKTEKSIFVETYILSDSRIVRALERAQAQGVRVYVLLERNPLGMGNQPKQMYQRLRAAGVNVAWSRPSFRLTHSKLMVLDERTAIISTANFSRAAFSRNREAIVFGHLTKDVRDISNVFRRDWDRIGGRISNPNLVISPQNGRAKLSELISRASTRVDIYAEEFEDAGIARLLVRLARKRVEVRVVLPSGARELHESNVPSRLKIAQLDRPYAHAKVVMVDHHEAFVGSENFSAQSLDQNREVGILIRGRPVAKLESIFALDWRRASRLRAKR